MDEDFRRRIRRLYASVGEVEVRDLSIVGRSTGTSLPGGIAATGGATPEQLENVAAEIVLNIANLRDHARKAARAAGRGSAEVDQAVSLSEALRIVVDLAEREKHGGDRRDGGESRLNPRLSWLVRGVELGAPRPTPVHISFGPSGLVATPEGLLAVVLNGPIVDSNGKTIGYFKDVVQEALRAWEDLFRKWGIIDGAA